MGDIELHPDTVLQLAPGLRARRDPVGHVLVDAPVGTIIDAGPDGFGLLDRFSRPVSLGEVVSRLESDLGGSTSFAPTMGVLNMLIEESAVVVVGSDEIRVSGWADPVEHARMLHDDRRTSDFVAAVVAVVRPGDVVVDIGTGSGVLAVAAARAGASRVYAIEASDIADVARQVFAANDVADRVTLIPGWSRQVVLPELADVLVTETIGNEPFEEEILETVVDARLRLLRPGGLVIPEALTILARPVRLPEAEIRQRTFGRAAVARWQALYGIDFNPLLDVAFDGPVHTITEGEVVGTWPVAGPPVAMCEVPLNRLDRTSVHGSAELTVDGQGPINAVAVTFKAQLHGAITHTLDPWRWPASSWGCSVWVLPEPIDVPEGASLRVAYDRRVEGCRDGLTCEVVSAPD